MPARTLGFPPVRHQQHELEADGWRLVRSERPRPDLPRWLSGMRCNRHEFVHADHPAMEGRKAVFVARSISRRGD